jgi:predicted lipoprotein with Yx(FWY)xxD motif
MNSRIPLLAVSAAALAVVTACSSSGGGSGAAATSAAPPSSSAAAPAATSAAAPASSVAPAASAAPAGGGAHTVSVKAGHLVAPGGRSLYILTSDRPGHPACSGACLQTWPPLSGTGTPGTGVHDDFATIARGTGTQVTFDKHPLYMFAGDTAAGDTKGNGIKAFGGTWQLATSAKTSGSDDSTSAAPASSPAGGYG